MPRTKVMEPLRWALPSAPVERELLVCEPATAVAGRPPILFVHGAYHGAWCWAEHWLPAAADRGWHCAAVSLRGHGASGGHDRLRRWKFRDYEHDVMQAITQMPSPPVLVGHSMGALIVERVLERYPAPAAVLLTPPGPRHGLGTVGLLLRRKPDEVLRSALGASMRLGPEDFFSDELDPAEARRLAERFQEESPLAQFEITVAPRRPRPSRAPVLVLGGERDALVPVTDVVRTARHYRTQAHVFRGMGHDLMLERRWHQPLDLMLDWLETLA